jgi:hypothetical protein
MRERMAAFVLCAGTCQAQSDKGADRDSLVCLRASRSMRRGTRRASFVDSA